MDRSEKMILFSPERQMLKGNMTEVYRDRNRMERGKHGIFFKY